MFEERNYTWNSWNQTWVLLLRKRPCKPKEMNQLIRTIFKACACASVQISVTIINSTQLELNCTFST